MSGGDRLRARLLAWFDREKRELPWRGTRDPWAVWVSEVMLQQTTVPAVLPRYPRFLERFPTVESLARADLDSVLAAWSGLGYYARARNLHRAARIVVDAHGGRIPEDPDALRRLPGIGDYMAQAIAAIAFGRRAIPVEANVRRIVSRLGAAEVVTADAAARLVSPRRPGDSIAALFDLGQTICRPRNPACARCPLRGGCRARALDAVDRFPSRSAARPLRPLYRCVAAAVSPSGRILVRRRAAGFLAGMWELPGVESDVLSRARERFRRRFRPPSAPFSSVEQPIAGRRVRIEIYSTSAPERRPGDRWLTPEEIEASASPSLTKKIVRRVSAQRRGA